MDAQMKINGEMIRTLREKKSWSQEHLADAAGLSTRTVQRVEADGFGSPETRLALAAALGVPVSTLLLDASPPPQGFVHWNRMPLGGWVGLGIGAASSLGAISHEYLSGAATVAETSRSFGIVCALLGVSLGLMGAIRGWVRGRAAESRRQTQEIRGSC
ncbi:MAG: helix-turn-helix domain-containing protein [Nevskiaceae bacterium]|jgi:DNA-binding XRE family transcriptional regulator|nr:helix-turn-helix domain-containing protein [Nevskiaceae bacterium]